MRQRIAIIGALSPFGQSLLSGLADHGFPARSIYALDSDINAGDQIAYGCQMIPLLSLHQCDFQQIGLSFLTTPTLLSEDKEKALRYGQYLIDCIGLFNEAPCIISHLNLDELKQNRLIANPTGLTITLSRILQPLHQHFKIHHAEATVLLSASEFGQTAIQALINQTRSLYTREQPPEGPFQKMQAFNLLPEIAPNLTRKTIEQIKKILHFPISLSSCLTPIFQGSCYSLTFTTKSPCSLKDIERVFQKHPFCRLYTSLAPNLTISTQDTGTQDLIYLTHIHLVPYLANTFHLWIICDSLKTGSVLNAIHLATHILND